MKTLYGTLIGIVALLMVANLALAGPPSWDEQINKPSRFKVLKDFGNAAVLDKETGLVWEQSPVTATLDWVSALVFCNGQNVGNRLGWRLPTLQELASLIDPTQSGPALPSGHPFSNVQSSGYWSASTYADSALSAWYVDLSSGDVARLIKTSAGAHVWCVRGGQGVDPQ